jgi:hypothetical protein
MAYYGKFEGGLNGDWEDLVVADATLSGNVVLIQNKDPSSEVLVVFDGAKPSSMQDGFTLCEGQVLAGSGTSIWVRASGGYNVAVQDKE